MDNQSKIVEKALAGLMAHIGAGARWVFNSSSLNNESDGTVIIIINNTELLFNVEIKRELRPYHMSNVINQARHNPPLLLVADRLYPAQKELLREHQISYLDTSGNACIRSGEVFILIDGLRAAYSGIENAKTNRAFTKAGLKVVFALLQNQRAINYSYRELASFAGVALGTINEVMAALTEAKYLLRVNKTRLILDNKKQLLEHWLIAYGNILKPSLSVGTYQLRDAVDWRHAKLPNGALWGGEPAGDIVTEHLVPEQWTIYVGERINEVAKTLQLIPKQEGNLKIFRKFWTDAAQDTTSIVTPDLVIYADLLLTGDQRCIETANIIYQQQLSATFES